MADIVHTLKSYARKLNRGACTGNADVLRRLRKLDVFQALDDTAIATKVKRRHCLAVVARELGFRGWPHATQVLGGAITEDVGTLLYPRRCGAHLNIWCASYDQAKRIRGEHGGFLLGYKRQYLIVDEDYIATLGIDPRDPDLDVIDRDWMIPDKPEVRARLYAKVVAAELRR